MSSGSAFAALPLCAPATVARWAADSNATRQPLAHAPPASAASSGARIALRTRQYHFRSWLSRPWSFLPSSARPAGSAALRRLVSPSGRGALQPTRFACALDGGVAAEPSDAVEPQAASEPLQDPLKAMDVEFYNALIRRAVYAKDYVTAINVLLAMRKSGVKANEETFVSFYPFELDDFQLQAFSAMYRMKNVVVSAPTGAGKTVIGEYAIYQALALGRRVFYTTPLKALSNQKLRDFREQFGYENVGLVTGDVCINRDAPILVMTTEIYRNMLYGTRTATPIGEVSDLLLDLHAVVLDEFHFMNDPQRGTVWEESVIYTPRNILLVALSATMANSDQLTAWIDSVHGPTELVTTSNRPVPLQFSFCDRRRGILPLLNKSGDKMNPKLKVDPVEIEEDINKRRSARKGGRRSGRGGYEDEVEDSRSKFRRLRMSEAERKRALYASVPSVTTVLTNLQKHDMLPAIYFIFSRRACDAAVNEVFNSERFSLVSPRDLPKLDAILDEFAAKYPEEAARYEFRMQVLRKGVASHHAGMLPVWKQLVEELFQNNLVKVVFATETLAAGINMPARCTVISTISKRTNEGHAILKAAEFMQMAGRAGRRGKDTVGYVVTLQTAHEGAKECFALQQRPPEPLQSQFTPSYGMVLNLLQRRTLAEARELVERSFSEYLTVHGGRRAAAQREEFEQLAAEREALAQSLSDVDWGQVAKYEKLRQRLKAEERLLRYLRDEQRDARVAAVSDLLPYSHAGTILLLKNPDPALEGEEFLQAAVLVERAPEEAGLSPYYVCLTRENDFFMVTEEDVWAICSNQPGIPQSDIHMLQIPQFESFSGAPEERLAAPGDEMSLFFAEQIPDREPILEDMRLPEVSAQEARVQHVVSELEGHPIHDRPDRAQLLQKRARSLELEDELKARRRKGAGVVGGASGGAPVGCWSQFLQVVEILKQFSCLDEELKITPIGEAAASVRGENELWLGTALASDVFLGLSPAALAAACAAVVMDVSRADAWTSYLPSPEVSAVLDGVEVVRERLAAVQEMHGVEFPVPLDRELIGLIENWALGVDWGELCANTSLDEGDVFRVLRRTLDVLAQVPHVPNVMGEIKETARQAYALMDRFPVTESVE